jgi:phosphoribosylanthranilate isomerase
MNPEGKEPIRIKLCGLSRLADIEAANEVLPAYAGFVFAPSRRRVTPEQAARLISALDRGIQAVGVFVNDPPESVARIAALSGLRVAQLHGAETPAEMDALRGLLPGGTEIWKAFRVKGPETVPEVEWVLTRSLADRVLLDAWHPEQAGGTGEAFDWSWLAALRHPYLLAGGLHVGNVADAVAALRPWGVDVSSGIETDGKKDADKMRAFVAAVRQADARTPRGS